MDCPPPSNDDDGRLQGNDITRRIAAATYLMKLMRDPEAHQREIDRLGFDPVETLEGMAREYLGFDLDDPDEMEEPANDT